MLSNRTTIPVTGLITLQTTRKLVFLQDIQKRPKTSLPLRLALFHYDQSIGLQKTVELAGHLCTLREPTFVFEVHEIIIDNGVLCCVGGN